MSSFIFALKRILAVMLTLVLSIGVGSPAKVKRETVHENCLMRIAVLSDVHVEGNNLTTYNNYGKILKSLKNIQGENDVTVFLGDNTMNGQNIESMLFYGQLKKAEIPGETIVVCGNHDLNNVEHPEEGKVDYNTYWNRFVEYNKLANLEVSSQNYYREIGGYYFIVLNPEDLCVNDMPYSRSQLEFLDKTLEKATAEGKEAFVLCHYPYNYSLDYFDTGLIKSIINKYENVYWLSGHTHADLNDGWTFRGNSSFGQINMPRVTEGYNDHGDEGATGWGSIVEVYEDCVEARAFNFITGNYCDEVLKTY